MIYNVKTLSVDELAMLYIKESQKLDLAVAIKVSHNSIMMIKKHLEIIACELNRKQPVVKPQPTVYSERKLKLNNCNHAL